MKTAFWLASGMFVASTFAALPGASSALALPACAFGGLANPFRAHFFASGINDGERYHLLREAVKTGKHDEKASRQILDLFFERPTAFHDPREAVRLIAESPTFLRSAENQLHLLHVIFRRPAEAVVDASTQRHMVAGLLERSGVSQVVYAEMARLLGDEHLLRPSDWEYWKDRTERFLLPPELAVLVPAPARFYAPIMDEPTTLELRKLFEVKTDHSFRTHMKRVRGYLLQNRDLEQNEKVQLWRNLHKILMPSLRLVEQTGDHGTVVMSDVSLTLSLVFLPDEEGAGFHYVTHPRLLNNFDPDKWRELKGTIVE